LEVMGARAGDTRKGRSGRRCEWGVVQEQGTDCGRGETRVSAGTRK